MFKRTFLATLLLFVSSLTANAQVNFAGGSYLQNFNGLVNSPTNTDIPFTNNVTLQGWYFINTTSTRSDSIRVSSGTDNTGSLYSFGAASANERALGSIGSNTVGNLNYGLRLTNVSGVTIDSFTVQYDGEQWRNGGNTTAHSLLFAYSLNATSLTTGTFNNVAALNFTTPVTGASASALNGNANFVALTSTVTGINWLAGSDLWLRWFDANDAGNDHALAIDNLNFTATAPTAVPEPNALLMFVVGALGVGIFARRKA